MIGINRDGKTYELPVDVLEEISYYDWRRARPKEEEMVACSPFRDEDSPSFSINLETGLWRDFGAIGEFGQGNLVTLLSYLRNDTPTEVEDYLLDKYGIDLSDVGKLELNFDLSFDTKVSTSISIDTYKKYAFRSPYLAKRGISEKVQRAFKIGYDKRSKAIAFAWFDVKGNIINVKFRSTENKRFFYFPTGQPIRNHLYGMNFVFKMNLERVFIVESEIDALYLWTHNIPAIALGGSNISEKQKQLILRSPIKQLVIATDNDAVGREIKGKLINMFLGIKDLEEIVFPENVKDINDLDSQRLEAVTSNTKTINLTLF